MPDINDIRLSNAKKLAERHSSTLAAFAERIDRAPTQVSRFMGKNPTKNIGDKVARHIESCFNLEPGWLDQIHSHTTNPDITGKAHNQNALLTTLTGDTDQVELLRSVIQTVEEIEQEEGIKLSPKEKAQAITACLQTCLKRGLKHSESQAVVTAAIQAVI